MSGLKRLTPQQSRKANALIKKTCCNCMGGNCILLDDGDECVCPQLISYSLLCRWFQKRRTSRRQAALRGALPSRGQAAVRRVRCGVCVHLKQRQILPGLPQADHPQASRRADAETTRPRYAVGAKKPLRHAAFQTRFEHDRGFMPKPAKTVFYCVTDH